MLPAQPPNSRRSSGTRNDTFSMWICSGRMCSRKRPWNTMMLSYAIEPQIRVRMALLQVEQIEPIAGRLERCGFEIDPDLELASGSEAGLRSRALRRIVLGCQHAPGDGLALGAGEGQLQSGERLDEGSAVPKRCRQHHHAGMAAVRLQVRRFDAEQLRAARQRYLAPEPGADALDERLCFGKEHCDLAPVPITRLQRKSEQQKHARRPPQPAWTRPRLRSEVERYAPLFVEQDGHAG